MELWVQLLGNDLGKMRLEPELAQRLRVGRRAIMRPRTTHASMETDAKQ